MLARAEEVVALYTMTSVRVELGFPSPTAQER